MGEAVNLKKQAEVIAEAMAADFLEEVASSTIFMGSHIEKILAELAIVIYHHVEDPHYYGAAVSYGEDERFIALNTFHSLRMRYFTAAHEIWHLSEASQLQNNDFDHERAADRFAAAFMLPKSITRDLWVKLKKSYTPKEVVIHLADLSAAPYETVVRRLEELGFSSVGLKLSEEEWINTRRELDLPESPLDHSQPFERFVVYEQVVKEAVENGRLNRLTAANKVVRFNKSLATTLQKEEFMRIHEASDDEA